MKSMLYIGATLMIGASIYGFVDYKKTSHNKEFRSLYNEGETKKAEKEIAVKTPVNETKIIPQEENKKTTATPVIKKKMVVKKKMTPEKKLNYKLFSRAPLREFKRLPEAVDSTKQ